MFLFPCSLDPKFEKALQGIAQLQKLNSSDLDDTGSVGAGSELEDEGEDILVARGLEDALEVRAVVNCATQLVYRTNVISECGSSDVRILCLCIALGPLPHVQY